MAAFLNVNFKSEMYIICRQIVGKFIYFRGFFVLILLIRTSEKPKVKYAQNSKCFKSINQQNYNKKCLRCLTLCVMTIQCSGFTLCVCVCV